MMIRMRDDILKSQVAYYNGLIAKHQQNVEIYLTNPVGIGEHPDVMAANRNRIKLYCTGTRKDRGNQSLFLEQVIWDLAKDLKVGTKRSHTAAENTKFVASFLRGVVDEDSYKTLMRDFYFVYSAIEEEMQRLEDDGFLSAINFQS